MSDHIVKVKDEPTLVKDTNSGAILNTDHRGLEKYRRQKAQASKLTETAERLERLEVQMGLILELLQKGKE